MSAFDNGFIGSEFANQPEPHALGVKIDFGQAALAAHIADTTTHGTIGDIVGTTDNQTISNKTISGINNTITGIDHTGLTNIGTTSHNQIDAFISRVDPLIDQSVITGSDPTFGTVTAQITTTRIKSPTTAIDLAGSLLFNAGTILSTGDITANQYRYNASPQADNTLQNIAAFDPQTKTIKTRSLTSIRDTRRSLVATAPAQALVGGTFSLRWNQFTDPDIGLGSGNNVFEINSPGLYSIHGAVTFAVDNNPVKGSYLKITNIDASILAVAHSVVSPYATPTFYKPITWSTITRNFLAGENFEVIAFAEGSGVQVLSAQLYIEKSIYIA